MFYGEHLNADEVSLKCRCGEFAIVEVIDDRKRHHGWFCRRCSHQVRACLRQQEKLARAIVRKESR